MIRYKSITHERVEDAPFVGALVCALNCNIGCKGCFNQSLIEAPELCSSATDIMDEIQNNPFNEGVILAGLEWSLQPKELISLVKEARLRSLPVIVYTGHNLDVFLRRVPSILDYPEVLIKHGAYDENKLTLNHMEFGVRLASSNQHIQQVKMFRRPEYQQVV